MHGPALGRVPFRDVAEILRNVSDVPLGAELVRHAGAEHCRHERLDSGSASRVQDKAMTVSLLSKPATHSAPCIRIGELARLTALSPDTLRAYEKRGLVKPIGRSRGRFREYRRDAVDQVRWVQNALAFGFTLAQLSDFRRERARGKPPCRKVRAVAEAKLRDLDIELTRLNRLRSALRRALRAWDQKLAGADPNRPLGLLDALGAEELAIPRGPLSRGRFRSWT
jgi:DNA-binding transcriptional MerR regulator